MRKIVNMMVALRRLPPLSDLSGDEERMLFALRELWSAQGALSVADVYELGGASSPTTAYRRLMALKDKGLVDVTVKQDDKRKRAVKFTRAAEALFSIRI